MNQTFELMVAWRYLRERGSRAGYFTMGVGALCLVASLVFYFLEQSLSSLHPFELTDSQLTWKQVYQWGKIAWLTLGILVIVFGIFHRLQSIFTTISTFGVFLGTAALVIVLSVMNGFEADLRHKILGSNAHILVSREDGAFTDYREIQARLVGLCARARPRPCVVGITPYLSSEVLVATSVSYNAVIVKGIDPKTIGSVTDLPANIGQGSLEELYPLQPSAEKKARSDDDAPEVFDGKEEPATAPPPPRPPGKDDDEPIDFSGQAPDAGTNVAPPPLRPAPRPLKPDARVAQLDGILVGRELAKNLHLYVGQEVDVVSPIGVDTPTGQMPRARTFRVAGVFYTGMYEYDAKFVYTTIPPLQAFLSLGDEVTGLEIKVSDVEHSTVVADEIVAKLGPGYRVQDWKELNRSLFTALGLEQMVMFIILTIIILVAGFSIVSNLIMVVVEKGREIATLKSIGASDLAIMRIFVYEGVFIGLLGTLFGLTVGIAACIALKYFGLPLNSDVYYIDRLPVAMAPLPIACVAVAGIAISVGATLYPAYIGARLRPIDGLKR